MSWTDPATTQTSCHYDSIDMLTQYFHELKRRNPNYSLRTFASKIEINSGVVSQIISRKRNLTPKMARRIASKLYTNTQDARRFIELSAPQRLKKPQKIPVKVLRHEEFTVIKEWHYFAILSLVKTKSFIPDMDFVAERLGISRAKVEMAVRILARIGYLEISDNEWKLQVESTKTKNDIPSKVIREYHMERLETAMLKLKTQSVDEREFGSIIFNCRQQDIPKIKSRIRDFRKHIAEEFEIEGHDEVCNLNIQFMKLTQEVKQ